MRRAGSARSVRTEEYELELGGHVVYPSCKVNVRWKGTWYNGTVARIGPQQPMCRVRDTVSNHTLLLDPDDLKAMKTSTIQGELTPGTRVAYNNGDSWSEGVVEATSCIGAALVRWRPSVHVTERETWFEMADLAPVIENEAYLAHNEDLLEAGRSGLLHNDPIEPHPRQMDNVLYHSDDSDEEIFVGQQSLVWNRDQLVLNEDGELLDENQPPQHRIPLTLTSSLRDNNMGKTSRPMSPKTPRTPRSPTLPEKKKQTSPFHNTPLPPPQSQYDSHGHTLPHHHTYTLPHPHISTLPHPHTYFPPPFVSGPWGMYESLPYNPYMYPPQRRPLSPVKLPPNKTLEQTSLPCAWSYTTHYHNGIPPHSTSSFFNQVWGKLSAPIRNRSKVMPRKLSSPMKQNKKSPSNVSKAASEPTCSSGLPPHLSTIEILRQNGRTKSLLARRASRAKSPKSQKSLKIPESPSLEKRDLAPLEELPLEEEPKPYEVPLTVDNIYEEVDEVDGVQTSGKTAGKKASKGKKSQKEKTSNKESRKSPKSQKSLKSSTKSPKSPKKDSALALTIASSSPPEITVNAGGTTLLTCLANAGKKVTYQWFKDDEQLPNKAHPNKIVTAPGILEVRKCSPADSGLYSCTVSNNWGTSSRSFNLTVATDIPLSPSSGSGLPQIALPQGSQGALQPSFNKVTHEELSMLPVEEDGSYEPESVQQFLDSLVEEIHISDDEFNVTVDYSMFDKNELTERPPADGRESSSPNHAPTEETDQLHPLPQITIAESTKSLRSKVRRTSSAIKNDNEDYLEGYGADYGAVSSATDLTKEGLAKYAERDIAKKLKQKEKKRNTDKETIPKEKKFSLFSRSKKKGDTVKDSGDILEYKEMPNSPSKLSVRFADELKEQLDKKDSTGVEVNSLGVNTSLGSENSESSLVREFEAAGKQQLQLPIEEESISEQVRRLQQSVEEYQQELETVGKGKKNKFFKRTKY